MADQGRIEEIEFDGISSGGATPASGSGNAQDDADHHSEDEDTSPSTLNGRNMEQKLVQLENKLAEVTAALSAAAAASAAPAAPIIRAKSFKPDKMRPYKGLSEGEHDRWFRDVDVKMMMSPEYFTTDSAKILYCMDSLEGDPSINWWQHTDKGATVAQFTFDQFRQYLLDLLMDPANRRLANYIRWEEAHQKPGQKVSVFKAYLEELEGHLPQFTPDHKAMIFFAKLTPELRRKIIGTGKVPSDREGIMATAIMQENTLQRQQTVGGNESLGGRQKKSSHDTDSTTSKPRFDKARQPNSNRGGRGGGNQQQAASKRKADEMKEDRAKGLCFGCKSPDHFARDCPTKDKWPKHMLVAAINGGHLEDGDKSSSSKKEAAPPAPRKRSKKD